jgi:hypothetical protein
LAAIAGKPLDRYQVNFKDEQRAKMHAFAVLRSTKQGQSVLRHTLKMGRCGICLPWCALYMQLHRKLSRLTDTGGRTSCRMVSLAPAQTSGKSQQRVRPLNASGEPAKPERTDSGSDKAEKKSDSSAVTDAARAVAKATSANGSGSGSGRSSSRAGGEAGGRTKRSKMTFEEAKENVTKALGVAGSHTSMIQVGMAASLPPYQLQCAESIAHVLD